MSQSPSGVLKRACSSRPLGRWHVLYGHKSRAARWPLYVSGWAIALFLLLGVPVSARSQTALKPQQNLGQRRIRSSDAGVPVTEQEAIRNHKVLALLNAERQKSMVSDANKLLRLARELNDEVASGDSGPPPSRQARKAAEIEKLARNVREKMSFAISASPGVNGPFDVLRP